MCLVLQFCLNIKKAIRACLSVRRVRITLKVSNTFLTISGDTVEIFLLSIKGCFPLEESVIQQKTENFCRITRLPF